MVYGKSTKSFAVQHSSKGLQKSLPAAQLLFWRSQSKEPREKGPAAVALLQGKKRGERQPGQKKCNYRHGDTAALPFSRQQQPNTQLRANKTLFIQRVGIF